MEVSDTTAKQFRLFPFRNPLRERLPEGFFRAIPRVAGIYLMRDARGGIIYVGKAKNLRARLLSYGRAQPHQVSRKVIRLVNAIRAIDWEECASEEAALLRENELLREHRPRFNVVNTSPHSYYFVTLREYGGMWELGLTTRVLPAETAPDTLRFGAYKGRRSIARGYSALLRLLWAAHAAPAFADAFAFPPRLVRERPAVSYTLYPSGDPEAARTRKTRTLLRRFLHGNSRALIDHLTLTLLERDNIPRFLYLQIEADLHELEDFFAIGPHRNRRLRRFHGLPAKSVIEQAELDDLIVIERLRRKRRG